MHPLNMAPFRQLAFPLSHLGFGAGLTIPEAWISGVVSLLLLYIQI